MRSSRSTIGLAVAIVVLLLAMVIAHDPGYPLVYVPQGMSNVVDGDRAFLWREGTLRLTAFSRRSPARGGGRVVWCRRERVFFDAGSNSLWDSAGRYAFGDAPRDLDELPVDVSDRHIVRIGERSRRARGRSKGTVDKGVFEFFQRYLNRGNAPLNPDNQRRLVWCPDPLD